MFELESHSRVYLKRSIEGDGLNAYVIKGFDHMSIIRVRFKVSLISVVPHAGRLQAHCVNVMQVDD